MNWAEKASRVRYGALYPGGTSDSTLLSLPSEQWLNAVSFMVQLT